MQWKVSLAHACNGRPMEVPFRLPVVKIQDHVMVLARPSHYLSSGEEGAQVLGVFIFPIQWEAKELLVLRVSQTCNSFECVFLFVLSRDCGAKCQEDIATHPRLRNALCWS